jgi:hypothetical protein
MFHILTNFIVLQLIPAASVSSPAKSVGNADEVKSKDDVEVYQQVKYFRRSIHEVNQLLGEPGCDVMDPVDKKHEPLGGSCDSEVVQVEETEVPQDTVQTEAVLQGCEVPQECSLPFVEAFSEKLSTEDCLEMEPGYSGQHQCVMESESHADCEPEVQSGSQDTMCHSVENHEEDSKFCDSVIKGHVVVPIETSERQASDDKNESLDNPVCASAESPQLSPEHRRLVNLDPNPNRRRFESEIGRDILRERRMRQELEEMRIANQGWSLLSAYSVFSL